MTSVQCLLFVNVYSQVGFNVMPFFYFNLNFNLSQNQHVYNMKQ